MRLSKAEVWFEAGIPLMYPKLAGNKIELVKTRHSIRLNVLDILILALQVVPMAEIIASSRNGRFPTLMNLSHTVICSISFPARLRLAP